MAWNYYLICIYEKGMRKSRENYKYYKDFETFTCPAITITCQGNRTSGIYVPWTNIKSLEERAYSKLYCKSL